MPYGCTGILLNPILPFCLCNTIHCIQQLGGFKFAVNHAFVCGSCPLSTSDKTTPSVSLKKLDYLSFTKNNHKGMYNKLYINENIPHFWLHYVQVSETPWDLQSYKELLLLVKYTLNFSASDSTVEEILVIVNMTTSIVHFLKGYEAW